MTRDLMTGGHTLSYISGCYEHNNPSDPSVIKNGCQVCSISAKLMHPKTVPGPEKLIMTVGRMWIKNFLWSVSTCPKRMQNAARCSAFDVELKSCVVCGIPDEIRFCAGPLWCSFSWIDMSGWVRRYQNMGGFTAMMIHDPSEYGVMAS